MRVYATVDGSNPSERVLVRLKCDGCDATIKPHPEIAQSGWMKTGAVYPDGSKVQSEWCPECYGRRRRNG